MATVTKRYVFEFDSREVTILLKLVGRESPASIEELGLDGDAFERLWSTLTEAAFVPMRDSHP